MSTFKYGTGTQYTTVHSILKCTTFHLLLQARFPSFWNVSQQEEEEQQQQQQLLNLLTAMLAVKTGTVVLLLRKAMKRK